VIQKHPWLFLRLVRGWKPQHSLLGEETELVLDGFTRSAVTFAAIAFQLAQDGHVRIAHHMHAAGPVVAAVRRNIPALIVVREPEPTVVSALLKWPRVTPRQWLKTYVAFYEAISGYRDGFAVGTFDEVTSDFGAVTRRLNERFGTRFREFEHTRENADAVFRLIDERAEGPPWQPHLGRFVSGLISAGEYRAATEVFRARGADAHRRVSEMWVQRPSRVREAAKAEVQKRYRAPALADLRARAEEAYRMVAHVPIGSRDRDRDSRRYDDDGKSERLA
jgi:hypothetical protein